LSYIHGHGIVHRDVKLENFLYEKQGSNHLKLIDFGFSKVWNPNNKMRMSCGTLSYVAPEVLKKSYTSQCDMWSLGVIAFILLVGYMPFSGAEEQQTKDIMAGKFKVKEERWKQVSQDGRDFVWGLLHVDPERRFTAESALAHTWIAQRHQQNQEVDADTVDALRQFGQASKFRRCCLEMMAWSLSSEERAEVRQSFIAMDKTRSGTITLGELKTALESKFQVPDEEAQIIFSALDSNHDDEIHYSDFLAAMVSTRIKLHDELLSSTFQRFDVDNSGFITTDNLREILGNNFEGQAVETMVAEADQLKDGRISYAEFVSYLRGDPLDDHADISGRLIDSELEVKGEKSPGNTLRRRTDSPRNVARAAKPCSVM